MGEHVSILGAGSWGLAIARLLDSAGHQVTVWETLPDAYETLVQHRGQPDKLPGIRLADSIEIVNSPAESLAAASIVVLAVPSQFLASVLRSHAKSFSAASYVVNLAKGIDTRSLRRMSEIIIAETAVSSDRVVTISGPSHAEEVSRDMPTTVVAAGSSQAVLDEIQQVFSTPHFRVYTSDDLTGVELGGSLKNIIAIAAGIADGLGHGDNTKGALITRGLAEITRLGVAMGARAGTFAGLSGIGDLVTTCASRHSRNRFVGEQIGQGQQLADILEDMTMIAEGVETTRSGRELARKLKVEMPITEEVYRVLFEQLSPAEAVDELMGRTLKAEIWK